MKFRKITTWILSAALLFQAVPVQAEPAEETITVESGDSVKPEEEMTDEASVSGNAQASDVPLETGSSIPVTPPDGEEDRFGRRNGYIDPGLEVRNPKSIELLTGASLPEKYVSPYITRVRDQGKYGTCWAFAGTGAIEASMVKRNGADRNTIDFSDLATAYFGRGGSYDNGNRFGNDDMTFLQDQGEYEALLAEAEEQYSGYKVQGRIADESLGYINSGGNSFYTLFGLAHWNGLIPESEAPYPSGDVREDHSEAEAQTESLESSPKDDKRTANLKEGLIFEMSDRTLVKNMLMEYGAVDVSYYSQNDYYSDDQSSFYQDQYDAQNHEVLLVGWDDTYPRENFNPACRPSSDGAWIIKNSWGTNWGISVEEGGERGYFYISYEDAGLSSSDANCYLVDDVDSYDHNYQYDGANTPMWYKSKRSDGAYMANVYKVMNAASDEKLNAVGIFTGPDVDYKVEIYKNPDTVEGIVKNPRTGKLIGTASGREAFMGYHTVPVSCKDVLQAGDLFSVVVYQKADDDQVYVFVDADYTMGPVSAVTATTGMSDTLTFHYYGRFHTDSDSSEGQSFTTIVYGDNDSWTDLTLKDPEGCNVRLKAFTSDVCTLSISHNSVRLFPGETYSQEVSVVKGKVPDGPFTYTSSDEKTAVVDASGTVTAVGEGTAEITIQASDGAVISYEVVVRLTDVSEVEFRKIPEQTLTDGAAEPKIEALYEGVLLKEGQDYTVSYKNNTKPASAKGISRDPQAVVSMQNHFKGEKSLHFSIVDKSSGSEDLSRASVKGVVSAVYTGREILQQPSVYLGGKALTEGRDYYLTYENNINAGRASVTINGCNRYKGKVVKNFTIRSASAASPEFTVKLSQYAVPLREGEQARPEVIFTDSEGHAVPKSDYTVSYKNNKKAGVAKVTIKAVSRSRGGSGNLKGSRTVSFVTAESESFVELENISNAYLYTGAAVKPGLTALYGPDGTTYEIGRNWKVKYYDNRNAGEALVVLTGKGEMKGKTGVCHFTIKKQTAANLTFSVIRPQKWKGKAVCPKVKIKNGKKTLKSGTDYTAYYYDNTEAGTGGVTFVFSGNYEGEKELSFVINQ